MASADAVCYRIAGSRSTEAAKSLLRDYDGRVLTDGYAAYNSLKKKGGRFELLHCWAHARRKFVEAEEFFPDEAREMLGLERSGPGQAMVVLRQTVASASNFGLPGDAAAFLRLEREFWFT